MALEIDIAVMEDGWQALPQAEALVRRAVEAVWADPELADEEAQSVSFALTGDAHIQQLNRDFRDKDKPTNVLSFPSEGAFLGDIAIAYETLVREVAAGEAVSLEAHLTHLTVHGVLHLLGFDHESEDEALAMEGVETAIMQRLGYPDPHDGGRGAPDL